MKPSIRKFEKLDTAVSTAAANMAKALEATWPKGSTADVFLNANQIVASWAEVVGYSGINGTVRVRLMKPNHRGDRHVCNVHWRNICFPQRKLASPPKEIAN